MIQFNLLSNETRRSQRPPWMTIRPYPELLMRLVPKQIKPIKTLNKRRLQTEQKTYPGKNNRIINPLLKPSVRLLETNEDQGKKINKKNEITGQMVVQGEQEIIATNNSQSTREISQPELKQKTIIPDRDQSLNQTDEISSSEVIQNSHTDPYADLPLQSIVLGVCDDNLPVALDLRDPEPGSILAIGDERKDQVLLLRSAVFSAVSRNSARAMQFIVFSHQPGIWQSWVNNEGFGKHCLGVIEAHEDSVCDWILHLADWIEQRRLGQHNGPPVLIVIDSLSFLPRLAYDIRLNFNWLVKEGPQAMVWTLAAISTELVASLGSRFLRPFQTRIYARSKAPDIYLRLAYLNTQQVAELDRDGKFLVQAGDRWLAFTLPG